MYIYIYNVYREIEGKKEIYMIYIYIYIYILIWFVFETLFLTSITATKSIFYLVGFLAPWFLTKISSKKANHKNARIFLPYVAPSLSSAAYLPLPLPTTTCRCLPLPATKSLPATTCNYLLRPATTSTSRYLPLPATACQCLPLLVSI